MGAHTDSLQIAENSDSENDEADADNAAVSDATATAQGCKSQWLCDKHNWPQRDSIPGPRALHSDMLPLDHCLVQSVCYARLHD